MWPEMRCVSPIVHGPHTYQDFSEIRPGREGTFRCPGLLRDPRQDEIEELRRLNAELRRKLKEAETT